MDVKKLAGILLALVFVCAATSEIQAAPPGAAQRTGLAAPCVYRATFIGDVTIPDNTAIPAGTSFVKNWSIRNDGTCAWGRGQAVDTITRVAGSAMSSPLVVPLDAQILPGQSGVVSVAFTAPATPGTYKSEWKFRQTNGLTFGLGPAGQTAFYVQIVVRAPMPSPSAPQRIQFATGATTASAQGTVAQGETRSYLIRALAGQTMTMAVVSPREAANFAITGVTDGQPYKRVVNEDRYFSFVLPSAQDYRIDVQTAGASVSYVLSVAISPR